MIKVQNNLRRFVCFLLIVLASFIFANSVSAVVLGISGNRFTLDGQAKFLVLSGYFDGMDAPNHSADLSYLQTQGFNGIRIFPNWWDDLSPNVPDSNPLITSNGGLDQSKLNKLISIVDSANSKGMVVDVSFAREVVSGNCNDAPGLNSNVLCKNEFKQGVVAVMTALKNKTNVFYDLSNEHDYPAINFPRADVLDLKSRVESAIGTNQILSVSSVQDGPGTVAIANGYPMDIVHTHFSCGQINSGCDLDANLSSALTSGKPTYIGEPNNTSSVPNYSAQDLISAVKRAKSVGIAAWVFHTDAGFNLNGVSLQSQLNSSQETGFINQFSQALQSVTWGGGGSGGTVPPPTSNPTALYCSSWLSSATKPACGCYIGGGTAVGTKQQIVKNAMTAVLPNWVNSTDVVGFKTAVVAYLNSHGEVAAPGNNGNCNQSANNLAIKTGTVNGIVMGEMYEIARDTLGCADEPNPTLGQSTPCRPNNPYTGSWNFVGQGLHPVTCTVACSAPPPVPPPPPTGPPTITGISPLRAAIGQTVEIYGTNLVEDIKLELSDGRFYTVTGVVDFQRTTLSFTVPDAPAGSYKVSVTGPSGSATSPQNLEIVVGGSGFPPPLNLGVPSEGLPTDLGQLIGAIFSWSLSLIGLVIFVRIF